MKKEETKRRGKTKKEANILREDTEKKIETNTEKKKQKETNKRIRNIQCKEEERKEIRHYLWRTLMVMLTLQRE